MEAHTVAEVRTVRTVVAAPIAEARVVAALTVAVAVRVAEEADVGKDEILKVIGNRLWVIDREL